MLLLAAAVTGRAIATGQGARASSEETIPAGTFVGDFEVPAPGWQQYAGLQAEDERPAGDSFALVGSPVRQGAKAARFTARHGYSKWGHNEDSELVLFGGEKAGDEYWYAWSTLFPQDWDAPHRWGIFAQWHARLGTSPIISLNARGDTASFNLLTGLTDEGANRQEVSREIPLLSTLSKGRWNDFLLHVRWTNGRDGLVELYHRVEGSPSMVRLVHVRDIPTFQFTQSGKGIGTYLLLGIYRGSLCPQPTNISCAGSQPAQEPSVLYHDGFTRATSFEDAARRAFPGALPRLVLTAEPPTRAVAAPIALTVRATPTGKVVERGGTLTVSKQRLTARVPGSRDTSDTAVATFRLRQQGTLVIRHRLRLPTPANLAGNVVVSQLRNAKGKVLAELYVAASDRTIRVYSPPGALLPDDINVSSDVTLPASKARAVELRLSATKLVLVVDGRVHNELAVKGPRRGETIVARLGIDHYDGDGTAPLQVVTAPFAVGAGR